MRNHLLQFFVLKNVLANLLYAMRACVVKIRNKKNVYCIVSVQKLKLLLTEYRYNHRHRTERGIESIAKTYVTKSYKVDVESHDLPRTEKTRYIEEKMILKKETIFTSALIHQGSYSRIDILIYFPLFFPFGQDCIGSVGLTNTFL